MPDDDLRFGDVSGGGTGGSTIIDTAVNLIVTILVLLLGGYLILSFLEILFGVPVPFV